MVLPPGLGFVAPAAQHHLVRARETGPGAAHREEVFVCSVSNGDAGGGSRMACPYVYQPRTRWQSAEDAVSPGAFSRPRLRARS